MSKDTQQVTARDGDSQADVISGHSHHCLRMSIARAVLVLQVTFIHTGLVFLLGTGTQMQTGQSGDLVTMQATEEGGNWGSLIWLVEQGPSLAIITAISGST